MIVRKKTKKQITVLITSAGSEGTLGIIRCLKNNHENRKIKVVCTDAIRQSILQYKTDSFHIIPLGNSKNYIKSLLKVCHKEKVDVVFPCHGSELLKISKNYNTFSLNGIYPAISKYSTIQNFMDKYRIYKILSQNRIPVPSFFLANNRKDFEEALEELGYPKKPVCIKPSKFVSSGGSRGFRILRASNKMGKIILKQKPNSQEIDYKTSLRLFEGQNKPRLLIMEYLSGDHWSVFAFANKGVMKFFVPIRILKKVNDFASEIIVQKNDELKEICKRIFKIFDFHSNIHLQFRLSKNGKPKLIEINPRIGGGIGLAFAAGLNLPFLAVKQELGEKLPRSKIFFGTRMIRFWNEYYIRNKKGFEFTTNL